MSRKYGKYAGTVYDNNDPKGLGRIKALAPKAGFDNFPTNWALPNFPWPGFWVVPTNGAKVWIEFEAGDTNIPIWSGVFIGAPGGKSEAPDKAGNILDLVIKVLGNIFVEAGINIEEKAIQKVIDATLIKLGNTASQGLIMELFGTSIYNLHTHNVTAVGSPTGLPLTLFVPASHATQKVKGE